MSSHKNGTKNALCVCDCVCVCGVCGVCVCGVCGVCVVCVFVFVCDWVCVFVCDWLRFCVCVCVIECICVCVYVCVWWSTWLCLCMCVWLSVIDCVCVCVQVCTILVCTLSRSFYGREAWPVTLKEEQRLRVFENVVLREILGLRRTRWQGSGENCIMWSFKLCTARQILLGWSNREEWDGRGMLRGWGVERFMQGFGGETWGKESTWET